MMLFMNRLISMLFIMMMMVVFPSEGRSLSFDINAFRNKFAALSESPEIKNKVDPMVLSVALSGYYTLLEKGQVNRDGILTVIDFNRPSSDERIFVIDLNRGKLLYSGLVAHGRGSGDIYAQHFSNASGSYQSSLGFYTTGDTYDGKNGYSLRLFGKEPGINDNAESRSIVIHGADYVSHDYIRKNGRLGRSQGCPALSFESFQQVINLIKGGSCLFIYHGGSDYAIKSILLNPDLARLQLLTEPYS